MIVVSIAIGNSGSSGNNSNSNCRKKSLTVINTSVRNKRGNNMALAKFIFTRTIMVVLRVIILSEALVLSQNPQSIINHEKCHRNKHNVLALVLVLRVRLVSVCININIAILKSMIFQY